MLTDVTMRPVAAADIAAIEALHDRAFGPGRYARTAYRVRDGLPSFSPLCRLAELKAAGQTGKIAAALRLAPITVGERRGAQLLGPLSVEPPLKGHGIGKALVVEALGAARAAGVRLIVLVGDLAYYERFGFGVAAPGRFDLGGPVDPARLLMLELTPVGAAGFAGQVRGDHTCA